MRAPILIAPVATAPVQCLSSEDDTWAKRDGIAGMEYVRERESL